MDAILLSELSKYCKLNTEEYLEIMRMMKQSKVDLSIENIDIDKEVSKSTSSIRLLTGIPEIDSLTHGLNAGVHILAGFRKCCKSTLALNIMYNALNQGLNVCMLSLEMSKIDLINTLVSLHSFGVNPESAITRDELSTLFNLDRQRYNDYLYDFMSLPGNLIIYTEKDIENNRNNSQPYSEKNLTNMFEAANKSCYQKNGKPVEVLVVDNINCIKNWEGTTGEKAISKASNFFRKISLNFGSSELDEDRNCHETLPVICLLLCQINRTGGKEALYSGFYGESSIAETVSLERDATSIIEIYVNPSYIERNIAMVKLEASRYSKAMLAPVEIPIYLEYGKIGYPIENINRNEVKKTRLLQKNKYEFVNVKLPNGKTEKILLPNGSPLPPSYKLLDEDDDEDDESW